MFNFGPTIKKLYIHIRTNIILYFIIKLVFALTLKINKTSTLSDVNSLWGKVSYFILLPHK